MSRESDQRDTQNEKQVTTLGGGCFWCLEAVFDELQGVERVVSGYAGGHVPNPTYQQVCAGTTGHAEVVQITFDPRVIPYHELLQVFFAVHDPTTPNRQGADVGPQYRSIILYHDQEQKRIAEEVIADLEAAGVWANPIVTEVMPLQAFYPAEAYHQKYFKRNPQQPYCQVVIAPKVAKLRRAFRENLYCMHGTASPSLHTWTTSSRPGWRWHCFGSSTASHCDPTVLSDIGLAPSRWRNPSRWLLTLVAYRRDQG